MLPVAPHATWLTSVAGRVLRAAGARRFKAKGRLVHHWLEHRDRGYVGARALPGGGRMICSFDVPYEAMVWARQEEENELRALQTLLSPGDHFVDCGANVGLWSLVAAGRVGAAGRVTAFEPNPLAYRRLVRNVAVSRLVGRRISAMNVAVAAQAGQMSFEMGTQHNLGRIVSDPAAESICVTAVALDDQFADAPIRALKLDIEGGEAAALHGAERILTVQRPWVWAEFNVTISGVDRIGDWDVFALLQTFGYRCRRIATAPHRLLGAAIGPDETFNGYVNVLFQPPNTDVE
jgi:FkbM family methyltransferase